MVTKLLLQSLLGHSPRLAIWLDCCDIYFQQDERGSGRINLIVDCQYPAIASLFASNADFLVERISLGCPFNFAFVLNNQIVVGSDCKDIQSQQQNYIEENMVATKERPSQTVQHEDQVVNLGQIEEPLQGMIRQQLIEMRLPVFPRIDGSYDVPETSYNLAWSSLGDVIKEGQNFPRPTHQQTTPVKGKSATKNTTVRKASPKLFTTALKPEEITTGASRTAIRKTLDALIAKFNPKLGTEAEILQQILDGTEIGQAYMNKLRTLYGKRDVLYKVKEEEWDKVAKKIRIEISDRLTPITNTPAEVTATET